MTVLAPTRTDRPQLPDGYGVPESLEGVLDWSWAVEKLSAAKNYWFSTTRPDGRPHAMPAWGSFIDGTFYFDGSPETRRGRNLAGNPHAVVHLESGDEVVVMEGEVRLEMHPDPALTARLAADMKRKYGPAYEPAPESWEGAGLYIMEPKVVFGWTAFPATMTRWRFELA